MTFSLSLSLSLSPRAVDEYTVPGAKFTVVSLFVSIGSFCGIFLGSFLLGCAMGLLTALVSWQCIRIDKVLVRLMNFLTHLSAKLWYNIDHTIPLPSPSSPPPLSLSVAL